MNKSLRPPASALMGLGGAVGFYPFASEIIIFSSTLDESIRILITKLPVSYHFIEPDWIHSS
jgi:hypothetical protein